MEESAILALTDEARQKFVKDRNIIAGDDVLDRYDLIYRRMSLPVVRQSEALLDEEESRRITNRLSDQSISSNSNILGGSMKRKDSFKDNSKGGNEFGRGASKKLDDYSRSSRKNSLVYKNVPSSSPLIPKKKTGNDQDSDDSF